MEQLNYELEEAISHNQELRDQIDDDDELAPPEATGLGSLAEMVEEMGEEVWGRPRSHPP
jgi:hypothetical protein